MLTIQDCIELSELTEEEILAIAEHEHIPEMAALELGNYLVGTPEGEQRIRAMIVDDIEHARRDGNLVRVLRAQDVPEALPGEARRPPQRLSVSGRAHESWLRRYGASRSMRQRPGATRV
jgi:hypothetical protein